MARLNLRNEAREVRSRGRSECRSLFHRQDARATAGLGARLTTPYEAGAEGWPSQLGRPAYRSPCHATQRDADRNALTVQPHLEVTHRCVAHSVERDGRQPLARKAHRSLDENVGLADFRPHAWGLRRDGGRQRIEEKADQVQGVSAEFEKRGLFQAGPPVFLGRGRVKHLLPALEEEDAHELAPGQPLLHTFENLHVAVLVVDCDPQPAAVGGHDYLVGFSKAADERLLAEDVRTVLEGQQGEVSMGGGGRPEDHKLGLGLLEQSFGVRPGLRKTKSAADLLAPPGVRFARPDELNPLHRGAGWEMNSFRNTTEAEQSHSHQATPLRNADNLRTSSIGWGLQSCAFPYPSGWRRIHS